MGLPGQLHQAAAVPPNSWENRAHCRQGRGIAPELGRADDGVFLVQHHQAVLLAAHADGGDLVLARARAAARHSRTVSSTALIQVLRILLQVARRQIRDEGRNDRWAVARMAPLSVSSTMVLVLWVPLSMPMVNMI